MILGSGIRDRLGSGFHAPCTSEHLVQSWMTIFFAVCRCYNCLFFVGSWTFWSNMFDDKPSARPYHIYICVPLLYSSCLQTISMSYYIYVYIYIYTYNIYIYIVLFFVRPWLDTLIIKYHLIIITSDLSRFEQHSEWFKRSISIYTKVSSDIQCYHQIFFWWFHQTFIEFQQIAPEVYQNFKWLWINTYTYHF